MLFWEKLQEPLTIVRGWGLLRVWGKDVPLHL